jgi:hypothetical protein
MLEASPVRITAPGLDPEAMTTLPNIAQNALIFQSPASGPSPNMSDWTRHEYPFA